MKVLRQTIPAIVRKLDYSIYFNCSSDCSSSGKNPVFNFNGVSKENPPTQKKHLHLK
jgi:hypothetical protein